MNILAVIPAYNEEASILSTIETLRADAPFADFIVVNDGSKDATSELCHNAGISILDLPLNLGLTGAFRAGMMYAAEHGYDAVIQFDADGQHVAAYIKDLADKMENDKADIVIGSRFVTEKRPVSMRMFGSILISAAIKITTGKKVKDPTSGMRLYSRRAIERFAADASCAPEPDTVAFLARKGYVVSEVQVQMKERVAGTSYLTAAKSCSYMTRIFVSILLLQWFR